MIYAEDLQLIYNALNIRIINENRKYWLVRTEGGSYYEDYNIGQFIALGYNKVTQNVLNNAYNNEKNIPPLDYLRDFIEKHYPNNKRCGLTASYINNFNKIMKSGDIVAIPSYSSKTILFGELTDNEIFFEAEENITQKQKELGTDRVVCPYYMRRNVRWITSISRDKLDLKFFKSMFSHNAIVDLRDYDYVIDRMLNNTFIKNNELHYKLSITTQESIALSTYLELSNSIRLICEEFNRAGDSNIECDFNDLTVKVQAESPGFWELISSNAQFMDYLTQTGGLVSANLRYIPAILVVAMVGVALLGGEFSVLGVLKFKTPGLSEKILEWVKFISKEKKPKTIEDYERIIQRLKEAENDNSSDDGEDLDKEDESNNNEEKQDEEDKE